MLRHSSVGPLVWSGQAEGASVGGGELFVLQHQHQVSAAHIAGARETPVAGPRQGQLDSAPAAASWGTTRTQLNLPMVLPARLRASSAVIVTRVIRCDESHRGYPRGISCESA